MTMELYEDTEIASKAVKRPSSFLPSNLKTIQACAWFWLRFLYFLPSNRACRCFRALAVWLSVGMGFPSVSEVRMGGRASGRRKAGRGGSALGVLSPQAP